MTEEAVAQGDDAVLERVLREQGVFESAEPSARLPAPASASRAHRALALVHEAAGQPGLAAACLEKAEAVETAGWEARKAAAASIPGAG